MLSQSEITALYQEVPVTRVISNTTVTTGNSGCFDATQTITVAGDGTDFAVENGAEVTLVAGENILLKYGETILAKMIRLVQCCFLPFGI